MTYSERIAARKAQYAAMVPTITEPVLEPAKEFSPLPFKLAPGKHDYYIIVTERTSVRPTHLLHIHECGKPLITTRHLFAIYDIPEGASTVEDIISPLVYTNSYERRDREPLVKGFSLPVVFHSKSDIESEAKRIINTNLND